MTNDEDREAFEYKAGRGGYYLDRDPSDTERYAYASTQAAWAMWRYARDHYRQQVGELVEAVIAFNHLYEVVMQQTETMPSQDTARMLRDARLEMVRQAKQHIKQEQRGG